MRKKKILVVTGTRAEYGVLKSTMLGIRASNKLALRLLVTGMHTLKRFGYTLNEIKRDRIPIDAVVPVGAHDDMLTALAKEIEGIKRYCLRSRPDMMVVNGDRDEPLAAAVVAAHLKIPVAHLHGGDVSSTVVDEYLRHAITKLSHLHFVACLQSYRRVLKLGEESWRIHHVGAPGLDLFRTITFRSKRSLAQELKLDASKPWLFVLQHPAPFDPRPVNVQIAATLNALEKLEAEKIIVYPNSDTDGGIIIRALRKYNRRKYYHLFKNLSHETLYVHCMKYCDVMLGNSSAGIIESGFFHLPVVNIGNRQKNRECGKNVIHVDYNEKKIYNAITCALSPRFRDSVSRSPHPYGEGKASERIVKILETTRIDQKLLEKKL